MPCGVCTALSYLTDNVIVAGSDVAYATSDPATITLSVRYDNAVQTPQGTGIGTAVTRTIGTLSTGG